jgi:4,5-dihydroxyphthalate decarboxylase
MKKLTLSLACGPYDRTAALLDGRVRIEGVDVIPAPLAPEEAFHRAFKFGEFDITEMSMSSHVVMTSRGEADYVGVPAFISRVFRHSGIYIRTDRGIKGPADLRGKLIGIPEYQITANVWIRGILQDDFGVKPAELKWRRGGIEEPGRGERAPITLPKEIDLQQIPDDKTLSGMLEAGELDAVIGARAPSCFLRGAPNIGRLFPDRKTEEEYYTRTKIFPIMHLVGIRKALVDEHPWLPVSVYKAFCEAREHVFYPLGDLSALHYTLPWSVMDYEHTMRLFGNDYWSYGLKQNQHVVDTFLRYHHEQGLSSRRVKPEELFAPSTLDISKI